MSKIITIGAWKGGVGKTTLIYNLSILSKEKKILLIDFDSQCNLTNSFLTKYDNSILNNPLPLKTKYPNIDVIASDIGLISKPWNNDFKTIIEKYKNNYDFVVIDIPPHFIIQGFSCSDEVYLITDGSSMSYTGLITIINQYIEFCKNTNKPNNIKGIILNNLNKFKETKDLVEALLKNPTTKNILLEPYIYKRASINRTLIYKQSILETKDKQTSQLLLELRKKIFK